MALLPDKQKQNVGDNSLALQAQGDVHVTYGLGYQDVKSICTDLFNTNFPQLREEALAEARKHVQEYSEDLMDSLKSEKPEFLATRLNSPDVQFSINESIMQVAKNSSQEKSKVLKKLIIEKIKSDDEERNILINEAIELLPRLSKNQLSFLAFIHSARNIKTTDLSLEGMMNMLILANNQGENVKGKFTETIEIFKQQQEKMQTEDGEALLQVKLIRTRNIINRYSNTLRNLASNLKHKIELAELERRGFLFNGKNYTVKTSILLAQKLNIDESSFSIEWLKTDFPIFYEIMEASGISDLSSLDAIVLTKLSNELAGIYLTALDDDSSLKV